MVGNRGAQVVSTQKPDEKGRTLVQKKTGRENNSDSPPISKTIVATQEAQKILPKTQAVIIQSPTEGEIYVEVLNKAKAAVNLNSLQITVMSTR